ncbi:MAG: pantoate--beta-alanine ligase [Candidatus Dormibacteria bacterium]
MPTRTTDRPSMLDTPAGLRRWSLRCHAAGMTVGLVPTMGALHAGHLSLVRRALADCDRVAVSVFVNPVQFGPGEDLERYPRQPDADLAMLAQEGVHAVFAPSVEAMYPEGGAVTVHVGGPLADRLEAAHRPGHFDGVALVVSKLFIAARPDRAYFGAKDAQQCAVVQRVADELDTGVEVVVCPVVRDRDGLALSSRNAYLGDDARRNALAIPAALGAAGELFERGERDAAALIECVRRTLATTRLDVDYVAVVEPERCTDVRIAGPGSEILVAARIESIRLLDCLRLGVDDVPVAAGSNHKECSGSS